MRGPPSYRVMHVVQVVWTSKPAWWGGSHVAFGILLLYFDFSSVAVTVSTHLCIICRHFCCPMLLFQGHVSCRNLTLTGPHMTVLCEISCIRFIVETFLLHCKVCNCPSMSFSALTWNLIIVLSFFSVISFCVVALNTPNPSWPS